MWTLATFVIGTGVLLPTHAVAEVCDKVVGEHWRPSDGPVRLILDPPGGFSQMSIMEWLILLAVVLAVPAALTLAALALRVAFSRRGAFLATWGLKWVGYAIAAVVVIITLYAVHGLWLPEDYRAILAVAAREGCIVLQTNWLALWSNTGMAAGVLLLHVWTAYRMHRFGRAAEARYRGRSS